MEIKIFGKKLFEFNKNRGGLLVTESTSQMRESKYLPDFHRSNNDFSDWSVLALSNNNGAVVGQKEKKQKKPINNKNLITPKGVYEMKTLNDKSFVLNTNVDYVEQQLKDFQNKLGLLKKEEYDMQRGVEEVGSVIIRMENRKKYPEVKDFFEQFPYTTTSKIAELTNKEDHLQLGKIAQFVADLPKEAVDVMREYNENVQKICKKDTVFYIIANKEDFKKSEKRRDPILLAQSPFGHVWQILGAWDKEMMFLEEL